VLRDAAAIVASQQPDATHPGETYVVDPLLPVIVGGLIAVAGGLIATLGTIVNGWIQSRRDNRQWMRQTRLDVYLPAIDFLRQFEYRASVFFDLMSRVEGTIPREASADQIMEMRAQYATEAKEYYDYLSRVESELAAVVVLGPEPVRQAVEEFARAAREKPTAWFNFGRDFPPVVQAMRKALRIPR
jgi:hypothetical protein